MPTIGRCAAVLLGGRAQLRVRVYAIGFIGWIDCVVVVHVSASKHTNKQQQPSPNNEDDDEGSQPPKRALLAPNVGDWMAGHRRQLAHVQHGCTA